MLGVIADDLTGALDAALLLFAGGVNAPVIVGTGAFQRRGETPATVILDVDSRGDSPDVAYHKVRGAARALLDAGYGRLYKKMSSTFQGHIGREVDAAMDESGAGFAIVVPAFPANGRTTEHGVLYVDGVPIADTGFGRHPTSPITDSFLPRVLQTQTSRRVGLVDLETVRRGSVFLAEEFRRLASNVQMAVVDVKSEHDLEIVATAARDLVVSSGGSALAGSLPGSEDRTSGSPPTAPASAIEGSLVIAGSVSPATARQVAYALSSGVAGLELDPVELVEDDGCSREVDRAYRFVLDRLRSGRDAMVYTPQDAASQSRASERARELGKDRLESGLSIAGCVSEVAARVIASTGLNRLLVAGGDTSSTVCARLGLEKHEVLAEIQTGIPLSLSTGSRTIVTVLKSGNFGTEDFFLQAIERLKEGMEG